LNRRLRRPIDSHHARLEPSRPLDFQTALFRDFHAAVHTHGASHYENSAKVLKALSNHKTLLAQAAAMASASILATSGIAKSIENGYELSLSAIANGNAMKMLEDYKKAANSNYGH
jgi:anthranilate phosphoribosyltransferase